MRKFACFTPLIVFAIAVVALSGFAVAKGAVVKKAAAGQCVISEVAVTVPAPALSPDIAVVLSAKNPLVLSEEEAIPATKNAGIDLVLGSMKSNSLNKAAPASTSPAGFQDFECAMTYGQAVVVERISVARYLSVVRT